MTTDAPRAWASTSDAVGASDADEPSAGEPCASAVPPPFGRDRFERRQLVGIGGMGRVTVVYDRALGREVALKEPSAGHEARLLDEARRASALEHPGIVPVLDAGVAADGRPWYTMRLLRGRPLEEVLCAETHLRGRLGHVRALLSAAEAIAYAHSRGVIHRDVTPANVLVGDLGEVCVVDWGLAAMRGTGGGGGTRGYRAPEQEAGAPADARADVHGLGALLYRICSGSAPGAASALPADTPVELSAIVTRAMSPRPGDRYPDARAFAEDLAAWLDGRPVSAHDYSRWELARRFAAAHRAALTVGVVALTALVTVSTSQYLATVHERDRALAAEAASTRHFALALAAQAVEAFRDGRLGDAAVLAAHAHARVAHDSDAMDPVENARVQSARAHALGVLAGVDASPALAPRPPVVLPPGCDDVRLHADGYVCLGGAAATAWSWAGEARGSWPGRWVDAAHGGLGIVLLGMDGVVRAGASVLRVPAGLRPSWLSVGGAFLATVEGDMVRLRSLVDGTTRADAVPCASGERVLAAVADERGRLAVACSSQDVFVGGLGALARVDARLPHPSVVSWLEGDLLVGTIDGEVVRLGLDGVVRWRASVDGAAVTDVGTAGSTLVWARTPRRTTLLDLRSGALRTVLPALRAAPAASADGVLRGVTTDGQVRGWALPSRWPATRLSTPSGLSSVAVSPDGQEVALGGRATSVARWRPTDGAVQWDSLADGVVKAFVWRVDGLLATVSGPNATYFLDARGTRVDPLRSGAYRRLGALPDGRVVALPFSGGPTVWNDAPAQEETLAGVPECHDLGVGPSGVAMLDIHGGLWTLADAARAPVLLATLPDARAVDAGPGGRSVVATSDRLVVLSSTGEEVADAPLLGRTVADLAWSRDGALIATGNLDGTADLWRAGDLSRLATLAGHTDRVAALAFAPDGSWLVTASWDRSARRWSLAPVIQPPSPAEVEARWGATLDGALAVPHGGEAAAFPKVEPAAPRP